MKIISNIFLFLICFILGACGSHSGNQPSLNTENRKIDRPCLANLDDVSTLVGTYPNTQKAAVAVATWASDISQRDQCQFNEADLGQALDKYLTINCSQENSCEVQLKSLRGTL